MLVSGTTDWASLDSVIAKTFRVSRRRSSSVSVRRVQLTVVIPFVAQDYLTQVDPTASLGLSCDSLHMYQLTQGGQRVIGADRPPVSPSHCLSSGSPRIFVTLKGLKFPFAESKQR